MIGRLFFVGGVAWLAALLLFAALLQWSARRPHHLTPAENAASELARALNKASHPGEPWPAWAVRRATSAQKVMVVDVDAEHPEDAQHIASEIVAPLHARYDEVLIYVKSADPAVDPTVRRIQWTPRGGFVERDYR